MALQGRSEVIAIYKGASKVPNLEFQENLSKSKLSPGSVDILVVKLLHGWDPNNSEKSPNAIINNIGRVLKKGGALFITNNNNFAIHEKHDGQMISKELAVNMAQFDRSLDDTLLRWYTEHYFSEVNQPIIDSCLLFENIFSDLDEAFLNILKEAIGSLKPKAKVSWKKIVKKAKEHRQSLSDFIAGKIEEGLKNKGYAVSIDNNKYLHITFKSSDEWITIFPEIRPKLKKRLNIFEGI